MTGSSLVQINRSEFISMDERFRIQYFSYRGGTSAWVISSRRANGWYFAVDYAPTLDAARARYFELVAA